MNTSKHFVIFFILFFILNLLQCKKHYTHDQSSSPAHKKKRNSKILPLPHIHLTTLSKIRLQFVDGGKKKLKAKPLPEFINPYTLGKREFIHVMEVLDEKHQLKESVTKDGDLNFKLRGDAKIKPINRFLQRSVQKATAVNI